MIRPLTIDDTASAQQLLTEAGLGSGAAMIARYLRWPHAPYWGWFEDGALIGSCGVVLQGRAAFVGGMAVRPAWRRRGLGKQLLEHVHASISVDTFLLEATSDGEPMYAGLGYVGEHDTAMMTRTPVGTATLAAVDVAELPAMIALDREVTGVDRSEMLRELVAEGVSGLVLAGGYGLAYGGRVGPVVAMDDATGAALLAALMPGAGVIGVPLPNQAGLATVTAAGFVQQRLVKRMRLGPAVAVRPERVWALASAGLG